MPLPNEFYYAIASSDIEYSLAPTNDLSISRLLENRPYWKKPSEAIKLQPKTLIINRVSDRALDANEQIILSERLGVLIQSGFKIYAVLDKIAFLELDKDNLNNFYSRLYKEKLPSALLTQKAIKDLDLSHDELLTLKAKHIRRILEGDDEDWNQLKFFQSVDLTKSNISKDSLIRFLSAKGQELESLILAACLNLQGSSSLADIQLPQLQILAFSCADQFPSGIEMGTALLSRLRALPASLIAELVTAAVSLKSIDCRYLSAQQLNARVLTALRKKNDLQSIKYRKTEDEQCNQEIKEVLKNQCGSSLTHLDLYGFNINSIDIEWIFQKSPNIQFLKIIEINSLLKAKKVPPQSNNLTFLSLETLELQKACIQPEHYKTLLIGSPNAKKITINQLPALEFSEEDLAKLNFNCLEELDLDYAQNSALLIQAILLKNKGLLKRLELKNTKLHKINFTQFNFTSLEKINFSGASLSAENVSILLQNAALKLKTIDLSNMAQLGDDLNFPPDTYFPNLESIELTNTTISAENLAALVMRSPNLKTLMASQTEIIYTQEYLFTLGEIILTQMEHLDFNQSNVSLEILGILLQHTPNTQSVDLSGCINLYEGNCNLGLCSLEQLTSLDLNKSNINSTNVSLMLPHMPNITYIDLSECSFISDNFHFGSHLFLYLTYIDLNESGISTQGLDAFLRTSPKLEFIDLSQCINLEEELFCDDLVLWELKTLYLKLCTLPIKSVNSLLNAAPKLSHIYLNVKNEMTAQENKEQTAGTVLLTVPKLNKTNLGTILNSSPNFALIDVSNRLDIEEKIELKDVIFPVLDIINCSGSNINNNFLEAILPRSPQLRTINLCLCKCIGKAFNLYQCGLFWLELLNLSYSNISTSGLEEFLINTPNLELLDLRGCMEIGGSLNLAAGSLFNLQSLYLSKSNINTQSFKTLLRAAPNLKYLYIQGCQGIDSKILWDDCLCSQLELFDTSLSLLHSETIKALLPLMPRLTELSLVGYRDLDNLGDQFILIHLKVLKITQTEDYDSQPIQHILATSKKLERLEITGQGTQEDIDAIQKRHPKLSVSFLNREIPAQNKVQTQTPNLQDTVDADTSFDPNKVHQVEQLFYAVGEGQKHPKVAHYRLTAFDTLTVNPKSCQASEAFQLSNTPDLQLSNYSLINVQPYLLEHEQVRGTIKISLSHDWQALPSLSPNELLIGLETNPDLFMSQLVIAYSQRDHFYYVRIQPDCLVPTAPVTLKFMLQIPKMRTSTDHLLTDILNQIEQYKAFQCKSLKIPKTNPTGEDFRAAMEKQRVGSCRHRSVLFKAWMEINYPWIAVRVINNACHSFVELKDDWNNWLRIDLGGYPATLQITKSKPSIPSQSVEEPERMVSAKATALPILPSLSSEQRLKVSTVSPQTAEAYLNELIKNENQHYTRLVTLDKKAIAGLQYALLAYCQSISKPCFYVHTPDDLICSASFIQQEANGTGKIRKGPGGPLHRFLTQHAQDNSTPLLLINYEHFTPRDLVRFNALLDEKASADGTPLPKKTQVLGLIDRNRPGAYDGADFYSRFDHIEPCIHQWNVPSLLTQKKIATPWRIELYGGQDWQTCLLGFWVLNGQALHFHPGALIRALQSNQSNLELSNAPWHDEAFQYFWQQALLRRTVEIQGITYPIPPDFSLSACEGYVLDAPEYLKPQETMMNPSARHALNPALMARILGEYRCLGDSVYKMTGLIEAHASGHLSLYVSHALTEAQWAILIEQAKTWRVTLYIEVAYGVSVPKALRYLVSTTSAIKAAAWSKAHQDFSQTAYIHSTDIDPTFRSKIKNKTPNIIYPSSQVEFSAYPSYW